MLDVAARPSRTTSRSRAPPSFYKKQGNHIITVETEHKSVLDTCKRLQREGCEVTYLRPQKDGIVTPRDGRPTR